MGRKSESKPQKKKKRKTVTAHVQQNEVDTCPSVLRAVIGSQGAGASYRAQRQEGLLVYGSTGLRVYWSAGLLVYLSGSAHTKEFKNLCKYKSGVVYTTPLSAEHESVVLV